MDFFEHQDRARRRSRFLVVVFVLAVAGLTAAVTLVVAVLVQVLGNGGAAGVPDTAWLSTHADLLALSAAGTVAFIGLASAYRLARLRAGGGEVVESLGGSLVRPDETDPLRHRLYNVVEEMAVASGIPVPAVYVLERESAINAFAAGLTETDAAVTVTRGALEKLDRDELQGVVAHEFSHVLNGDMRLNVRLMGYLFGILAVSMLGRAMLRVGGRRRVSRSRGQGGAVALAGLALLVLGYIGVLAGRIIQAAVSRQRELLADASAVQFTRQTAGIAGALRKIAGLTQASYLVTPRAQEVAHMLFGAGARFLTGLFATHPPIEERLAALEVHGPHIPKAVAPPAAPAPAAAGVAPAAALAGIGQVADAQQAYAGRLAAVIPEALWSAAHARDGATALLLGLLLDARPVPRQRQQALLEARFGAAVAAQATTLSEAAAGLSPTLRLSLLDVAFPQLRQAPASRREYLLDAVERLIEMDGRRDPLEAAVAGSLRNRFRDLEPGRGRPADAATRARAAAVLLGAMAAAGQDSARTAAAAWQAGADDLAGTLPGLAGESPPGEPPSTRAIGVALETLDRLPPLAKRSLLEALATAAAVDGVLRQDELDLLRAAAAALHCPIPPMGDPGGDARPRVRARPGAA